MRVKSKNIQRDSIGDALETVVNTISSHAIFTLDADGLITSWNKGAENISGWKKSGVIHQPLSFLFADEKSIENIVAGNLRKAAENGSFLAERNLSTKSGKAYLADFSITAVYKKSRLAGYIVVAKDTTQRKKEEIDQYDDNQLLRKEIDRRKAIEKDLQESNNELEAFASAAGHDLQEPLRMVVSYLQLIKKRYAKSFDKDGLEFLEYAMDGATRMRQLISDLVEYSRIETLGKPFKKTDANLVLSKVLDSMEISIAETETRVTHDDLPIIWSDEVQLNELLQNLIANAIKFGIKGGIKQLNVHIGVSNTPKEYIFSVSDNGPGIAQKDFEKIFLIFKQLGNKLQAEGSGIGLAICRKIVKRHKGRIWVESELGKGTTFKFTIPRIKELHE